jgi:hypothetical protein
MKTSNCKAYISYFFVILYAYLLFILLNVEPEGMVLLHDSLYIYVTINGDKIFCDKHIAKIYGYIISVFHLSDEDLNVRYHPQIYIQ